ncbi:3831_t:CDS:2 [Entrophospora sp. SA101]|nr:3831_t:CDS:2 [Entrophospora sp. SA101]
MKVIGGKPADNAATTKLDSRTISAIKAWIELKTIVGVTDNNY